MLLAEGYVLSLNSLLFKKEKYPSHSISTGDTASQLCPVCKQNHMLPCNYKYTGVSFGCEQWKGGLKAFCVGLALPSLASKGAPGTRRLLSQQGKETTRHDTLLPLGKKLRKHIKLQNQPKILSFFFFF